MLELRRHLLDFDLQLDPPSNESAQNVFLIQAFHQSSHDSGISFEYVIIAFSICLAERRGHFLGMFSVDV
jgi:hypothetical protein